MKEVDWDNWEIEKLTRMYPYLSNEDLCRILKRSINSIQHKASRLNLKKDKEVNALIRGKAREGEKCCNWKGGRKINKKGHILILKKGNPMADKMGYVLEHRLIMSEKLGRPLTPEEKVHHENEIKTDNRVENLKVMSNGEHTRYHNLKRSKERLQEVIK